jgi:hypothetical protein
MCRTATHSQTSTSQKPSVAVTTSNRIPSALSGSLSGATISACVQVGSPQQNAGHGRVWYDNL